MIFEKMRKSKKAIAAGLIVTIPGGIQVCEPNKVADNTPAPKDKTEEVSETTINKKYDVVPGKHGPIKIKYKPEKISDELDWSDLEWENNKRLTKALAKLNPDMKVTRWESNDQTWACNTGEYFLQSLGVDSENNRENNLADRYLLRKWFGNESTTNIDSQTGKIAEIILLPDGSYLIQPRQENTIKIFDWNTNPNPGVETFLQEISCDEEDLPEILAEFIELYEYTNAEKIRILLDLDESKKDLNYYILLRDELKGRLMQLEIVKAHKWQYITEADNERYVQKLIDDTSEFLNNIEIKIRRLETQN